MTDNLSHKSKQSLIYIVIHRNTLKGAYVNIKKPASNVEYLDEGASILEQMRKITEFELSKQTSENANKLRDSLERVREHRGLIESLRSKASSGLAYLEKRNDS